MTQNCIIHNVSNAIGIFISLFYLLKRGLIPCDEAGTSELLHRLPVHTSWTPDVTNSKKIDKLWITRFFQKIYIHEYSSHYLRGKARQA